MKKYLFIIFFGLCYSFLYAQQNVLASSGKSEQRSTGILSWTLGEPVIETHQTTSSELCQGFQQNEASSLSPVQQTKSDYQIFPNPTRNFTLLTLENPENTLCNLYDMRGILLKSVEITDHSTLIDLGSVISGIYVLKIIQKRNEVQTLTLIKN